MKGGIFEVFLQARTEKTLFMRKNDQKIWNRYVFLNRPTPALYI